MKKVSSSEVPRVADENIRAVARLQEQAIGKRSWVERFSDAVAASAARESAVAAHVVWFVAWLLVNTRHVPAIPPFDPFPFPILTITVSLEAIFLTLFVLASQN